jgi:threonine dehydrogenase-like Zn-dependent dehydrogenase
MFKIHRGNTKLRVLVFNGKELEFVKNYPDPIIKENEALVKVLKAGICNTDIEILKGYIGFKGVLGHEFVGKVVDSKNKDIIGKKVVSEINCPCGTCEYCMSGLSNHCPTRTVIGIAGKDGIFADYINLPIENLHIVPDELPDEDCVFVELIAACFRVLQQIHIKPTDNVVILGDGKLGSIMARVLRLTCCNLTLAGLDPKKIDKSSHLGIKTCLSSKLKSKSDFVIECTGTPKGLSMSKELVKPSGTIVQKSTFSSTYNLDISRYVVDEIRVVGSRCGPFEPAIRALQMGLIKVQDLIDSIFPFDQALSALARAQQKDSMKVLMDMGD